jgi:predicted dinucleotide-utilizing enzyme
MTLGDPIIFVLAITYLAFAAVVAVVSVGAIADVVLSSRRTRLARHESIRTYYGGHALTH